MFGSNTPSFAYNILALIKPRHPKTETEIELRYADKYVGCDGYMWEGRIIEASEVSENVEGELKLTPVFSDFSLTLSNHDGALTSYLLDYVWTQAECRIYVIPQGASSLKEGLLIFRGYVAKENGVEVDGDEVRITIDDMLKKYDIELPNQTYARINRNPFDPQDKNEYVQKGKEGEFVPIIWGDWQDMDGQYKIPVVCIDTRKTAFAPKFQLCDLGRGGYVVSSFGDAKTGYGMGDLLVVNSEGSRTYPIIAASATSGWFVVSGDYTYQDGDEFYVRPKGNGLYQPPPLMPLLVDNPVLIAYGLLVRYAGMPSNNIDLISLSVASALTRNLKVRSFLNKQQKLGDILAQLGFEAGIRVRSYNGMIYFHVPDWFYTDLNWSTYYKNELIGEPKFALDPDGYTAGKWIGRCQYNPREDTFEIAEEIGKSNRFGIKVDQALDFYWLCDRSDLLDKLLKLEFLFGRHIPKIFEFTLSHSAMELKPLDGFFQELPALFESPQPFLTLETKKDFVGGTITVKALWLGYIFDMGRWTNDDHPSFKESTDEQKRYWGYWTYPDGTEQTVDPQKVGRCDPDDPNSNMSNWAP